VDTNLRKHKIMKALSVLLFTFISLSGKYIEPRIMYEDSLSPGKKINLMQDCPESNEDNHSELVNFFTKPYWSEERVVTGTGHLTTSQITLLVDSANSMACTTFNTQYAEAFEEKNGIGEQANDVTYYKAGNFYFVVITPRQSEEEGYITFGPSYIDIYDQNLNFIKGYEF